MNMGPTEFRGERHLMCVRHRGTGQIHLLSLIDPLEQVVAPKPVTDYEILADERVDYDSLCWPNRNYSL